MEVAARENAVAQENIHDLEDMVKKIARTEKIDESKELAEDIQDSLVEADPEDRKAGEEPRCPEGTFRGTDRRGHAIDPDGNLLSQ